MVSNRDEELPVTTNVVSRVPVVSAGHLLKRTAKEWSEDKAPQLGAALAYYTVFSLAPLVLLLLAVIGMIFRNDAAGAWTTITGQMGHVLDPSALKVIQDIAQNASRTGQSRIMAIIGVGLAILGASGVFGQLQASLNTIWGVKAKPGAGIWGFLRDRFLSSAMVGGICFLLLVSLVVESVLNGLSTYLEASVPYGATMALGIYFVCDFAVVVLMFALIFKFLPDVKIQWRDVWTGAVLTAVLFLIGKWALGLYLGSGAAGTAYGAATSLISLLLWIYYSSQILLFGAEFTQVYANEFGSVLVPKRYAVRIVKTETEQPLHVVAS